MGPGAHAVVSAGVALALRRAGAPGDAALGALLAGTLIDVDHLLDYVLSEGFRPNLPVIRSGSYFAKRNRAIVIFHSYELVVLAAAGLATALRRGWPAAGLASGAIVHVLCDAAYYRYTPVCYSLVYRALHRFELAAFRPRRSAAPVVGVPNEGEVPAA